MARGFKMLTIWGKGGKQYQVNHGIGLGIRQHDDVMLAWGYSRNTRHEMNLTAGQFMVIRLNVNTVKLHHAEDRILSTEKGSVRVKVYDVTGNEGSFPASPTAMTIFNQNPPQQETGGVDCQAEFFSYPAQASDPFAGLTPIDNVPLWVPSGGGPVSPSPDTFPSVKGRHYQSDRVYALVVENINGSETDVYYQYAWHEI